MTLPTLNWSAILPELVVVGTALLLLVVEFLRTRMTTRDRARSHVTALLTLLGLGVAAGLTFVSVGQPPADFNGMLLADDLSRYLNLIVLIAAILGVLVAWEYLTRFTVLHTEFYSLYLLAVAGMMFLAMSVELITLFVSLEILSVSLYVLTGFHRGQLAGAESALKYFLLGAFASAFVVYGAALWYGASGSTRLTEIAANASGGFLLLGGLALLLVGFGFKIAAVPFHMWTPDAYQGAPTPVTAFMSVGTKAAAFVALIRILQVAGSEYQAWSMALAMLAVLTMTLGNLAALRQRSLKRMLAYSSIAQAGYMMIGLVAGTQAGINAVLYYLFTYAFMNLGAFAVVSLLEGAGHDDAQDATIESANGLFKRKPLLALAMAVFMLSLAGLPPFAGFFGKLYLFNVAVESGWVLLAVIAVLNSVVSAYYYLRVTVVMFMAEPSSESRLRLPLPDGAILAIVIAFIGTLLLGLLASPWMQTLGQATIALVR